MEHPQEKKNIATKMLRVQQAVKPIIKDAENPYFKSKYFDVNSVLASLKPALNKEGLVVLQPLTHIEGRPAIETVVFDTESGERVSQVTPLPDTADAQKFGSAVTYYRRYCLVSFFALEGELDDDGNAASGKEKFSGTEKKALNDDIGF